LRDDIIRQVRINAGKAYSFRFLTLERRKYDSSENIEIASVKRNKLALLLEIVLEVTLLAHVRVIAGSMMGNVPRLALQLQRTASDRYVSLDGRTWCIDSSCRPSLATDGMHRNASRASNNASTRVARLPRLTKHI
jgi:hypothetical protein